MLDETLFTFLLLNIVSFNCYCKFLPVDLPISYSSYCERERKSQEVTDIYGVFVDNEILWTK